MELDFTQNRYLKVLSNRNLLGKILVGSFLLNVMQMIHLMTREDKIILVPPKIPSVLSAQLMWPKFVTSQSVLITTAVAAAVISKPIKKFINIPLILFFDFQII